MRTSTPLLALAVGLLLALAPAANAATPFTAGTGTGHDLAVGSDGSGHVVWVVHEGTDDRIRYCRVPPGGSSCPTLIYLDFPGSMSTSPSPHLQVFAPATDKVVVVASCHTCPDLPTRTFRFISTNNGNTFPTVDQVGNLQLNGQSAFINNAANLVLGVSGSLFQGQTGPSPGSITQLSLGQGGSVYDASAAADPGGTKAVYAVNDLHTVEYRVFNDPGTAGITAAELNDNSPVEENWGGAAGTKFLSSPESDNSETRLSSGPNGVYLTYRYAETGNPHVALRKFSSATDTFGGPTYIEGAGPIEDNSIGELQHSQDASGRLHVVWRSLFDGNRLRYTRSDDAGATFTPVANLATRETFFSPMVEAGPGGTGFAVWRGSANAIRVVPIDPQPEPSGPGAPGGPGGPDTTPPTAGTPSIADPTLTPGQGTRFTFTSSEAGMATLTIQKQVKGLKVRVRGKRRCVPQTRKRLRALRRQAGSPAAFRRLLRQRRCKAWKKIGSIKQAVVPGQNTIVFSGRIAGRRLRPGRYRAVLVIRDTAGNVSRAERVLFRVFRPRR